MGSFSDMKQIFRRNTAPTEPISPLVGFGIPNTEEKLKKTPRIPFRERGRVKVIAPAEYAHKTGHILELHEISNDQGLMEVELDHQLVDGAGYEQLTNPNIHRERIAIQSPHQQLVPYNHMKCEKQHFEIETRAETLLQISIVATFMLGFAIIALLLGIADKNLWIHTELFYVYLVSQSFCCGLGFYCVLITSFVGLSIRINSTENNISSIGSVHDDCRGYHWYKSTHWKPWWLCGRDMSPIEFSLQHTGTIMVAFFASFLLSIIIYISDQTDWYVIVICIVLTVGPSFFALHLIKNREMMSFA